MSSDPEVAGRGAGAAVNRRLRPGQFARPDHFTLHFREVADPTEQRWRDPHLINVELGGEPVGTLALYEDEWEAVWRAIVRAAPAFEREGITCLRTGKFR